MASSAKPIDLRVFEADLKDLRVPWFIAVYPNTWGRGITIDKALNAAKRAGARGQDYAVYLLPFGATDPQMDDMGRLTWKWQLCIPEGLKTDEPVKVMARGKGKDF